MPDTVSTDTQKLQMVPLDQIVTDPKNPRRHIDKEGLRELAASIKVHGVRQPVLLRPVGGNVPYQLVSGERRWRASKLAGQDTIPAIVDTNLSSNEALEIATIENLQRQDIHPVEEAESYSVLLAETNGNGEKRTLDDLARRLGKSVAYIAARLSLLALVPAGREAFLGRHITAGHAVLIARLIPSDQIKALVACFMRWGTTNVPKEAPEKVQFKDLVPDTATGLLPERALREWIQDNVNLQLKDVPWDLDDADLVPEAGACSSCSKRSTSNPALFSELAVQGADTCFDGQCYHAKREAFVKLTLNKSKEDDKPVLQLSERSCHMPPGKTTTVYRQGQWLSAKKGSCKSAQAGLIVRGEHAGEVRHVCVDPKCKVHDHGFSRRAANGSSGQYDHELHRFMEHKSDILKQKKALARAYLIKTMVAHVKDEVPTELLRQMALELADRGREQERTGWLVGDDKFDLANAVKAAKGARLNQILVAALLAGTTSAYADDSKTRKALVEYARVLKVKTPEAFLSKEDERIRKAKSCRGCGCTEETACRYWDGNKHVSCSWVENDLCSNPLCVKYATVNSAVSKDN